MKYEEIAENLSRERIISLLKLEEQNQILTKQISSLKTQLQETKQTLDWLKKQVFGKKSEKRYEPENFIKSTQLFLGEALNPQTEETQHQAKHSPVTVNTYQRGKAKKLDLANAVSDTGLRFDNTVPVVTVKVPNKKIAGLSVDEYEVISTKVVHRLAQTNSYKVLRYEMDVVKIKSSQEVVNTEVTPNKGGKLIILVKQVDYDD